MSQEIGGASSRVNYTQLVIDHLAGGKIGELSSGPVTATSSMPQGTVDYTIDGFDARQMDLDAFDRVFDPDRYENGVGDGQWVDAMPLVTYGTIVTEMAGTRVTLASMTMEHLRLRQPPRPFAAMLDTLMAHPDMLMAHPDTPPGQAEAKQRPKRSNERNVGWDRLVRTAVPRTTYPIKLFPFRNQDWETLQVSIGGYVAMRNCLAFTILPIR
jgi:hypothetical protein